MLRRLPLRSLACWMLALAAAIPSAVAQPKRDKVVWNYDGGVYLETDGALPNGACFRLKGRLNAPQFFDDMKREDTTSGTVFRHGNDIVTEFPKQLLLSITIFDMPCDPLRPKPGPHVYLTDEMLRRLNLSFYWKRELSMRPVRGVVVRGYEAGPIPDPFGILSHAEPQRYAWILRFEVPSEGIPLTDSLVVVLRTADQRIAARTAARL